MILQYPYGLQQHFALSFKHSQFYSETILQKGNNLPPITDFLFSSIDFSVGY